MTKNGDFPAVIREAAHELRRDRIEPAQASRMRARIMERVTRTPVGIAELLSGWLRISIVPLAAAAVIAVTATVIVQNELVDDYGTRTALVAMQTEALGVDE